MQSVSLKYPPHCETSHSNKKLCKIYFKNILVNFCELYIFYGKIRIFKASYLHIINVHSQITQITSAMRFVYKQQFQAKHD